MAWKEWLCRTFDHRWNADGFWKRSDGKGWLRHFTCRRCGAELEQRVHTDTKPLEIV